MHKGTDFAAPMGTPIMASGSGVITRARWCGGGGNCIKIKHNSTYQTIYAHMFKFAQGIRKGVRVRQGQTIGFVGSTGNSTGPHLHYEIIYQDKQINPMTMKLPSGKNLKAEELKRFTKTSKKIYADYLFNLHE
jgi:murein DD-endopeptidase MepM/ murein hydrolase activator NlpD